MHHDNIYGKVMFEAVRELHQEFTTEAEDWHIAKPQGLLHRIAVLWQRITTHNPATDSDCSPALSQPVTSRK